MSDYWSAIQNTLGRRQQRQESSRQRTSDALARLQQMLYGSRQAELERGFTTSEREAEEEFTAGENVLNRESEAALTEATLENARALVALRGDVESRLAEQQFGYQQRLQDDAQEFQTELAGINNEASMAELQARIQAEIDAAEAEWTQPRTQYDQQTETIGGRVYSWTSDQGYELQRLKMQQDLVNDQIRLTADLNGDVAKAGKLMDIFDAEFSKILSLHPDLWQDMVGWQRELTNQDKEQFRAELQRALDIYVASGELDPDNIPTLMTLLETRLQFASPTGEPEPVSRGDDQGAGVFADLIRPPSGGSLSEVTESLSETGVGGGLASLLLNTWQTLFNPPENPQGDHPANLVKGAMENVISSWYPSGVTGGGRRGPDEQGLYNQLMDLFYNEGTTDRQREQITEKVRDLTTGEYEPDDAGMTQFIREMLREIQARR